MAVMLDVKNINVYYGAIHAVKDISFQVNELKNWENRLVVSSRAA